MLPRVICGWILSPFPSILGALWRGGSLPASRQPAFLLPGSHTAAAEDARKTVISPKQTPEDRGRTTSHGDTLEPSHRQPWQEGTVPARQLVWVLRHLLVCLSLGNREDGKKYQCHIVTYESPLSTGRDDPFLPPPSTGRLGKSPRHPKSSSPQLLLPARSCPDAFPIPTAGDTSGLGTSVAQGQLSQPWKAAQEFAFIFAFPNCACRFPGAAAGFGFHGRFCADPENRGRHKGATMDLPLTRIKGGRWGGGTVDRGTVACPPRHRQHGSGRGERPWAGKEAGWQPTLTGHRWFWHCQSSGGDTTPAGLLDGGAESQLPSPGGGSCPASVGSGARADVPPFSFPVTFSQLSIQLGWVSFPFQLPYSI